MVNKSNLILIGGEEGFLKEEAFQKVRKELIRGEFKEFNYNLFFGKDAGISNILDAANTLPFMADKRMVVVKDADKLRAQDREVLTRYCASLKETTCMVLIGGKELLKDKSFASIRNAKVIDCPPLNKSGINSWISREVRTRGKSISSTAIETLKEFAPNDLESISHEIDKLTCYIGKRDEIGAEDIEKVVAGGGIDNIFDLGDAIGKNDVQAALKISLLLAREGKKPHETIGLIAWHIRRLYIASYMLSKGYSTDVISRLLWMKRDRFPEFIRQARNLHKGEIERKLEILLSVDSFLKTSRIPESVAMEWLIINLCQPGFKQRVC